MGPGHKAYGMNVQIVKEIFFIMHNFKTATDVLLRQEVCQVCSSEVKHTWEACCK